MLCVCDPADPVVPEYEWVCPGDAALTAPLVAPIFAEDDPVVPENVCECPPAEPVAPFP